MYIYMNKSIRIKHLSITVSINILIVGIRCNYIMYIYIVFATCPQTEVPAVPCLCPPGICFFSIFGMPRIHLHKNTLFLECSLMESILNTMLWQCKLQSNPNDSGLQLYLKQLVKKTSQDHRKKVSHPGTWLTLRHRRSSPVQPTAPSCQFRSRRRKKFISRCEPPPTNSPPTNSPLLGIFTKRNAI